MAVVPHRDGAATSLWSFDVPCRGGAESSASHFTVLLSLTLTSIYTAHTHTHTHRKRNTSIMFNA